MTQTVLPGEKICGSKRKAMFSSLLHNTATETSPILPSSKYYAKLKINHIIFRNYILNNYISHTLKLHIRNPRGGQ